ncbi:MAG: hypothetical protein JWR84_30 [Caulobacter sp.]|nr:hypothetical protein [Caulobacter sp.]
MWAGCYNLPKIHKLLKEKGHLGEMLYEPDGYLAVLRKATSKAA